MTFLTEHLLTTSSRQKRVRTKVETQWKIAITVNTQTPSLYYLVIIWTKRSHDPFSLHTLRVSQQCGHNTDPHGDRMASTDLGSGERVPRTGVVCDAVTVYQWRTDPAVDIFDPMFRGFLPNVAVKFTNVLYGESPNFSPTKSSFPL